MTAHEKFISRVYCLARKARTNGDHPFGALLVLDGAVTLECLNTINTAADLTRHPELDILRLAAKSAKEYSLTPEIEQALKANKKAWEHFNHLAPFIKSSMSVG